MQIPSQYIGCWQGEVKDALRVKPYHSEIEIKVGEVNIAYSMGMGMQKGEITIQCVSDGFILLKEIVGRLEGSKGSFNGTLLLYLDADTNLKCVWRSKGKFSSEATMTRAKSSNMV